MKKAILATKVGMTQIFNADGVLVPVTVLEAGPCSVTQIKTVENDGYSAVQVAFADKKEKVVNKDANGKKQVAHRHGVNKAQMGHFAKAGVSGKRFVKEFKFENAADYNLGDVIKADIFAEGTSSSSASSVPMVVTVTGMLLVRLTTGVFLTLPSTAAVSPGSGRYFPAEPDQH